MKDPERIKFYGDRLDQCLKTMLPEENFFGILDWVNQHPDINIPEKFKIPDIVELDSILEKKHPLDASRQVRDAHFLFYLPPVLNLIRLEKLYPHFRSYTYRRNCWYQGKNFTQEPSLGKWYLALLNPLPQSMGRDFEEAKKTIPHGYNTPSALEAVSLHLLYQAKNGINLNPKSLGRTASVDGHDRIIVGQLNHLGLFVGKIEDEEEDSHVGLFTFRKIKEKPC